VVVQEAPSAPALLPEGWLEAVVGTEDRGQPLPMVVMVHGLGDRPESMLRVMGQLPGPARLIAPRAPDRWNDGWSWFPTRSTGNEEELAVQMAQVAEQFVADLEATTEARPTEGKPILAGFSQGGMLSFTVAVHHPEAIALAVPVAGWLPEPLWPEAGPPDDAPPVRALHGLDDPVLPFQRTSDGVGALRSKGWDVSMQAFPDVAHQVPPQVRRALYLEVQDTLPAAQEIPSP
jgi:phospholipase/carboxylesterase